MNPETLCAISTTGLKMMVWKKSLQCFVDILSCVIGYAFILKLYVITFKHSIYKCNMWSYWLLCVTYNLNRVIGQIMLWCQSQLRGLLCCILSSVFGWMIVSSICLLPAVILLCDCSNEKSKVLLLRIYQG